MYRSALALSLTVLTFQASAGVYRCDAGGSVSFQDRPCTAGEQTDLVPHDLARLEHCSTDHYGFGRYASERYQECEDEDLVVQVCTTENLSNPRLSEYARRTCEHQLPAILAARERRVAEERAEAARFQSPKPTPTPMPMPWHDKPSASSLSRSARAQDRHEHCMAIAVGLRIGSIAAANELMRRAEEKGYTCEEYRRLLDWATEPDH